MTTVPPLISRTLGVLRQNILKSENMVREAGWQDLEEAVADIDVTLAAIKLNRPEGWQRARVLMGNEGPVRLLSELDGWEDDFIRAVGEAEPTVAAQ